MGLCGEEVDSFEAALRCGSSPSFHINESQSSLTDSQKLDLRNFICRISSLSYEHLKPNVTTGVSMLVLAAFSELTNPKEKLSTKHELSVVADTEAALENLAETLHDGSCASVEYSSNDAALCRSTSLQNLKGGFKVTTNEAKFGILNFNLSKADPDADSYTLVTLRKENTENEIRLKPHYPFRHNNRIGWTGLNSALLSFSFSEDGRRQSVPVDFSLNNVEEAYNQPFTIQGGNHIMRNPICAFWHTKHKEWSTRGCKQMNDQSSKTLTQCSCNHSTSFAVLMQIVSDNSNSEALTLITNVGCGTSIACLALTLSIYCFLWRMLRSDRIFIHTNLSITILAAQILFIAGIHRVEIMVVCKVIAFFLHFFYLSVFGWMLVEGVHLYMKVVKVYGSENIKMYRYVLIGWVAPAVICLISVAINSEGYGTDRSCWLDTASGAIWAFVAPALLVMTFNMFVLAMVVRIVVQSTKLHQEKQGDHIKAGLKGTLVLLPLLGMTWIFGMLAFNSATIVFQYLFVILNSFQGLFIFLIYCVFNSEVKAAIVRKGGTKNNWARSSAVQSTSGDASKQSTELINVPRPADRGRTDEDESAFNFANHGVAARIETPVLPSKPKVPCAEVNTKSLLQEATMIYDPRGLVGCDDDYECYQPTTGHADSTSLNGSISSRTGGNNSPVNNSPIKQQEPEVISQAGSIKSEDNHPACGRCSPESDHAFLPAVAQLDDVDEAELERASSLSGQPENDADSTSVPSRADEAEHERASSLSGQPENDADSTSSPPRLQGIRSTQKVGPSPWRYW